MYRFDGHHSSGSSFVYVYEILILFQDVGYTDRDKFGFKKKTCKES